jgi:hypothetical protein
MYTIQVLPNPAETKMSGGTNKMIAWFVLNNAHQKKEERILLLLIINSPSTFNRQIKPLNYSCCISQNSWCQRPADSSFSAQIDLSPRGFLTFITTPNQGPLTRLPR